MFESRKQIPMGLLRKHQEVAPTIDKNHPLKYGRKNNISPYQYKSLDKFSKVKYEDKSKYIINPLGMKIRFKPTLGARRISKNSKKTRNYSDNANNSSGKEKFFDTTIGQNKKSYRFKEQDKSLVRRLRDIFFQKPKKQKIIKVRKPHLSLNKINQRATYLQGEKDKWKPNVKGITKTAKPLKMPSPNKNRTMSKMHAMALSRQTGELFLSGILSIGAAIHTLLHSLHLDLSPSLKTLVNIDHIEEGHITNIHHSNKDADNRGGGYAVQLEDGTQQAIPITVNSEGKDHIVYFVFVFFILGTIILGVLNEGKTKYLIKDPLLLKTINKLLPNQKGKEAISFKIDPLMFIKVILNYLFDSYVEYSN